MANDTELNKRFVDFSKSFIDATKIVFETMLNCSLTSKTPTYKTDNMAKGDISCILGVGGIFEKIVGERQVKSSFKAMLVLSFSNDVYVKCANVMLGENHTEFNKEIADCGNEIINIIVGNSKESLNKMGYFPTMSIPSMVNGKDHTLSYPNNTNIILIPIDSTLGNFFIELSYSEA